MLLEELGEELMVCFRLFELMEIANPVVFDQVCSFFSRAQSNLRSCWKVVG